ncbi:uncharacterized protein LOC124158288 [Ischnura elegans]|uniref:uncharacterized protein LOC124158288 n=1 Tax=Ischnura elegans TaxID=197161 RepID=UPI001ED86DA3|nr:uncharacterized protein LOC124158288 [Ischnura elegans]
MVISFILRMICDVMLHIIRMYAAGVIQRKLQNSKIKKKFFYTMRLIWFQAKIMFHFLSGWDMEVQLSETRTYFRLKESGNSNTSCASMRGKYRRLKVTVYTIGITQKTIIRGDSQFRDDMEGNDIMDDDYISRTRSGWIYKRP